MIRLTIHKIETQISCIYARIESGNVVVRIRKYSYSKFNSRIFFTIIITK